MNRRDLLKGLLATAATTMIRVPVTAAAGQPVVRFGVITDVHQDVVPDGVDRIGAFMAAMKEAKAEFIIQLGDFCMPKASNREFLGAWNGFPGPRYHVIGNHDIEPPITREQTAAFWGMPGLHYTFEGGTFLGMVLDGNDVGGKSTLYRRYIGPDQLAWMEKTLMSAVKPVILFVHQPIDGLENGVGAGLENAIENEADVAAVLARVETAKPGSILAAFQGHRHQDYVLTRGASQIQFVGVNSAAYYWLGEAGQSLDYFPPDVHERYKGLRNVAVYREPLWAIVDVDRAGGEIRMTGRQSHWVGASAIDRLHLPVEKHPEFFIHPSITTLRLRLPMGTTEEAPLR